jgi:hypothetical protein
MKKILIYGVIIFLFSCLFIDNNEIKNDEIRLRIIGNSNEENDIYIKEKIKEECFIILKDILDRDSKSYDLVINDLEENINIIREKIEKIYSNVEVTLKEETYPLKVNNNNMEYNKKVITLLVKIDKANGDNYYTTLYPEFIQADEEKIIYKSIFLELLEKLKGGK